MEKHSLTHIPSQPWELDVGEWEHTSGTALLLTLLEISHRGDETAQQATDVRFRQKQFSCRIHSIQQKSGHTEFRNVGTRACSTCIAVQDTCVKHKTLSQLTAMRMTLRIRWRSEKQRRPQDKLLYPTVPWNENPIPPPSAPITSQQSSDEGGGPESKPRNRETQQSDSDEYRDEGARVRAQQPRSSLKWRIRKEQCQQQTKEQCQLQAKKAGAQ